MRTREVLAPTAPSIPTADALILTGNRPARRTLYPTNQAWQTATTTVMMATATNAHDAMVMREPKGIRAALCAKMRRCKRLGLCPNLDARGAGNAGVRQVWKCG